MNIAIILSGGTGVRMGLDVPKQYIEVYGRPIIAYCMESLFLHDEIDAVQIVADRAWQGLISESIVRLGEKHGNAATAQKFKGFAEPGASRQLSIYSGLESVKAYAKADDCVLIHDAARPVLRAAQISACLRAVEEHDGVLPVLPMKDTVYSSTDGRRVTALLNRREIYAGQAPEAFLFGKYYEANRRLLPERIMEINGSTEPAILAGMDIAMIPGDEDNFKITTRADLERFEQLGRERCRNEKDGE